VATVAAFEKEFGASQAVLVDAVKDANRRRDKHVGYTLSANVHSVSHDSFSAAKKGKTNYH